MAPRPQVLRPPSAAADVPGPVRPVQFADMRDDSPVIRGQRLLRFAFEHSQLATVILDEGGHALAINRAAHDLEAHTGIDLRRFFVWSTTRDFDLASFRAQLRLDARSFAEIDVLNVEGKTRRLALDGFSLGPEHLVTLQDVTELRSLEREVRHLRRVLREMERSAVRAGGQK